MEARRRFAEGHERYMMMLAGQILDEESGDFRAEYWDAIEEIDDFFWDWRGSGRQKNRSDRWDDEEIRFHASLHRFDMNLEYCLRKLRKDKQKQKGANGKTNDPNDIIGFMGGMPDMVG